MKMIGENEKGEVIYDELNCDVCETMTGPRTRYDNCLECGATKEKRVRAGYRKLADLFLSNYRNNMIAEADRLRKKFGLEIKLTVEFEIGK